jgi:hypothetical protein
LINKNAKSAESLIKFTWMRTHPSFATTDCGIGVVDWERINSTQWTFHQHILVEVFKFLTIEESNVSLDDLLVLKPEERQAVIMCLNEKFQINELEENLR